MTNLLSARLTIAVKFGLNCLQYHRDIVEYFVAKRIYNEIKEERERVDREQRNGKSFSSSVNRVTEAVLSESEIVRRIVEGIHPAQHSSFVF